HGGSKGNNGLGNGAESNDVGGANPAFGDPSNPGRGMAATSRAGVGADRSSASSSGGGGKGGAAGGSGGGSGGGNGSGGSSGGGGSGNGGGSGGHGGG